MDAETVCDFNSKILAMGILPFVINPLEVKRRQGPYLTITISNISTLINLIFLTLKQL
jgi:hypothetical protein